MTGGLAVNTAIQLTMILLALAGALGLAEATRRHVLCVRLERSLRTVPVEAPRRG